MAIAEEKYVSFTTFRNNGEAKPAPVWIADAGDGTLGFTTGASSWKLKRLANNPACTLQPCNSKGKVTQGSEQVAATARLATAAETPAIQAAIKSKYGFQVTMMKAVSKVGTIFGKDPAGDAAVVITLDQ